MKGSIKIFTVKPTESVVHLTNTVPLSVENVDRYLWSLAGEVLASHYHRA